MKNLRHQLAFTLAEVLITIGIVGVVASMTMPVLINKYRAKVLETGFKKSYSNISKAILYTKNSLGVEDLYRTYTAYQSGKGYYNANEFVSEFYKQINVKTQAKTYLMYNYTGTQSFSVLTHSSSKNYATDYPLIKYILPDGSGIGVVINAYKINFYVDTNGYKKPNKYGHDIFRFTIQDKSDKLMLDKQTRTYTEEELETQTYPDIAGRPCNKNSKQKANGAGCAWYAFNNINPDDETKTYWDNLPR